MLYLLSCCGSHLAELTLRSNFVISVLPRILELCPTLRHLRLISVQLDSGVVDCIREALGGTLRTLWLENCLCVYVGPWFDRVSRLIC